MVNTRGPTLASSPGEWNATLTGDYLWSNVNFGEAVTEAMTPLSWSVLAFSLDDWVYVPGIPSVGNIGGLPYLNISTFATLFQLLGRGREDLLRTTEATLYMRLPDDMEIPLIPLSVAARVGSIANGVRVQMKQRAAVRRVPAYIDGNPIWFEHTRTRVRTSDAGSLAALWRNEIGPHVKFGRWCVLGIAMHSADFTMALRRELAGLVGAEDASSLIANVSGDAGLASLEPLVGLTQLARGELAREAYLLAHGHRGPHEFELSMPRPAEDPAWLERELAGFRAAPVDIDALRAGQRAAFDAAWSRFTARHPRRAGAMADRIAESARRARLRELARSEYVRDRWLVRLLACRAGEVTGAGDDIFFLSLDEMLRLLTGDVTTLAAVPMRREAYLRYRALPPYPSIIRGRFDPFRWASDADRRSDIYDGRAADRAPMPRRDPLVIGGAPGSAGRAVGLVRVAANPEEGQQLRPGEVLVAVQTDIAWTLLFPRAAAVVTDIGAPLSHAAIVARELGIPAVVGCGDATARLKTGDRVAVDGAAGTVTLLQ